MKKLLIILSSSLSGTSSVVNINLSVRQNNNKKSEVLSTSESELTKIHAWHNNLSIEQDKIAKQDYLNAMVIKTTKESDGNFDIFSIAFDSNKLKDMLNKKIINQDVYNIWSSAETAKRLTNEANAIVSIPTNNLSETQSTTEVRAFQKYFYIQDNHMYFVDKDNPNPNFISLKNIDLKTSPAVTYLSDYSLNIVMDWEEVGIITLEDSDWLIGKLIEFEAKGYTEAYIDQFFEDIVLQIIREEAAEGFELLLLDLLADGASYYSGINYTSKTYHSKYSILDGLEKNLTKIKSENNKFHTSVEETFYLWGAWLDPSSIKAVAPINKFTTLDDKDSAGIINKSSTLTHYYNFDTLVSYSKYDSLWEFLNSNATFNLGKRFESSVGLLSMYKDYNDTFNKSQSASILKPYLYNWVKLTKAFWGDVTMKHSSAELDMKISNNPWNKTIYFNFKSVLRNDNTFESVENWMY